MNSASVHFLYHVIYFEIVKTNFKKAFTPGRHAYLLLFLTILNNGAYWIFKPIFHKDLISFSSIGKLRSNTFMEP